MSVTTYENVTVEYDSEADAWYIDLAPHVAQRTTDMITPHTVHFDHGPDGKIAGIEVL